ncbi:MAG: DUF4160 domain-containing protein [Oscillospiraceae bacterium]|nr:DUF4160 domain-containing protein [Oscillospiraceae bacterium]
MPEILKAYGYHIYFWSNESEPLEPIHVHFSKSPHKNATKYWILRDGSVLQDNNNDKIPINDLKKLVNCITLERNISLIEEKWVEHFGEISYLK